MKKIIIAVISFLCVAIIGVAGIFTVKTIRERENKIEHESDTTSKTELRYIKAEQADFDLFEEMVNKTAFVWTCSEEFDADTISLTDLIENYIMLDDVPFGTYTYFFGNMPEDYYKNPYKRTLYSQENGMEQEFAYYDLNADNADWIIKNVFGLTPDRSQSTDNYFYSDNHLYRSFEIGGGIGNEYNLKSVKELKNNEYGFTFDAYDEGSEESEIVYFAAELKNDSKIGHYWAISKFSHDSSIIGETTKATSDIYTAYSNKLNESHNKILSEYPGDSIAADYCPTYILYDLDNNGIKELIITMGICEADTAYEIYTYDSDIKKVGTVPCGHSCIAIPEDGNGLYIYHSHMDLNSLYRITLQNYNITKQTIYDNKNNEFANRYKLDFIEQHHTSDKSALDELKDD